MTSLFLRQRKMSWGHCEQDNCATVCGGHLYNAFAINVKKDERMLL